MPSWHQSVVERIARSTARAAFVAASRAAEVAFDRTWGVRTRGLVDNGAHVSALSIGGDAYEYEPANLLLWWRMERAIPAARSETTFVDLGAGLGRPAILAATLGYRRVVAVELDADLVRRAEDNIARWRSRRRPSRRPEPTVDVVHGDAAAYELPPGPLAICVYNSFGPVTLRAVLARVCGARRPPDEPVFLAYLNPVHSDVVEEFPQLTLQSRAKRWAVYRLTGDPAPPPAP